MKFWVYLLLLLHSFTAESQTHFFENADSLNKARTIATSSSIALVWAGSTVALSQVWYADYPKSSPHSFNDASNWLQMDKMGHVYTANKISGLTTDLMRWSGIKNSTSSWIGFGVGLGYQSTLEVMDGLSAEWGFSWSDMAANTIGSGLSLTQNLLWKEERVIMKFSYHPTTYAQYRPNVLGSSFTESLLKDYNGQTYWISVSPFAFSKNEKLPKWLCLSFGYSADEKLVGDQTFFQTADGLKTFQAKREWLFSLDIDCSKIPVKKQWLKVLLSQLNYIKIPFPTMRISKGVVYGHYLYF